MRVSDFAVLLIGMSEAERRDLIERSSVCASDPGVSYLDHSADEPAIECGQILSRLSEVVDQDYRTPNRISADAGLGRNYVRSIISDGKSPTLESVSAVLETLENPQRIYVLTGLRVGWDDMETLRIFNALPVGVKASMKQMLRSIVSG